MMADFKIGNLVRFANEQNGGPVHRVVSVMRDGMIELHDFGGYFAPHLFVEATDIADTPPATMLKQEPAAEGKAKRDRDALAYGKALERAVAAESTLASLEAENAALKREVAEYDAANRDLVRSYDQSRELRKAAQSEATRLRTGIQTLIGGPYAEQKVDNILDRLKALLEEADGK